MDPLNLDVDQQSKQHEDKNIHTNDDISDNIENNGEIVNYDAWWLSYPDTDITKQLQSLPFQGPIHYHLRVLNLQPSS